MAKSIAYSPAATNWAATVPSAAPAMPMRGRPHSPSTSPQSSTALTAKETSVTQVTVTARPIPASHPASAPPKTGKREPAMQMAK